MLSEDIYCYVALCWEAVMFDKVFLFQVNFLTSVFCQMVAHHLPIFMHTSVQFTDRNNIIVNRKIVFISEVRGISKVEINKGYSVFPSAVFIDRIGIMVESRRMMLE